MGRIVNIALGVIDNVMFVLVLKLTNHPDFWLVHLVFLEEVL